MKVQDRSKGNTYRRPGTTVRREPISSEWNRRPDVLKQTERATPEGFGVSRFEVGTRVEHSLFGTGTVMGAKDMGGDILYTVRFDNGQEKRLMATFAKLRRI